MLVPVNQGIIRLRVFIALSNFDPPRIERLALSDSGKDT
jgi:hypothetical protein